MMYLIIFRTLSFCNLLQKAAGTKDTLCEFRTLSFCNLLQKAAGTKDALDNFQKIKTLHFLFCDFCHIVQNILVSSIFEILIAKLGN